MLLDASVAQWTTRLTTDQEIPSSNLGGGTFFRVSYISSVGLCAPTYSTQSMDNKAPTIRTSTSSRLSLGITEPKKRDLERERDISKVRYRRVDRLT